MTRISFNLALALTFLAAPVMAQEQQSPAKDFTPQEVEIPFAQLGGIDDWRADGNRALYIKGRRNNDWYYAKLMSTCQGLIFAQAIGFRNEANGEFSKFSTILVDGQPCQLTSLVKSEKPTAKK